MYFIMHQEYVDFLVLKFLSLRLFQNRFLDDMSRGLLRAHQPKFKFGFGSLFLSAADDRRPAGDVQLFLLR